MHPICLHFVDWLKKNLTTFWEITNDTVASYFDPIYEEQQSMLLCYTRNKSTHYFFKISDYPMATTALSVTGYLFIDCTWISVYLITSELFPTVLR